MIEVKEIESTYWYTLSPTGDENIFIASTDYPYIKPVKGTKGECELAIRDMLETQIKEDLTNGSCFSGIPLMVPDKREIIIKITDMRVSLDIAIKAVRAERPSWEEVAAVAEYVSASGVLNNACVFVALGQKLIDDDIVLAGEWISLAKYQGKITRDEAFYVMAQRKGVSLL